MNSRQFLTNLHFAFSVNETIHNPSFYYLRGQGGDLQALVLHARTLLTVGITVGVYGIVGEQLKKKK